MPDKTNGMVIHEQICINLLVTVLAKALRSARSGCSLKYSRIAALSARLEESFASKPRISSSLSGGKSEMGTEKAEGVVSLSAWDS